MSITNKSTILTLQALINTAESPASECPYENYRIPARMRAIAASALLLLYERNRDRLSSSEPLLLLALYLNQPLSTGPHRVIGPDA